jgi:hypothetical protein
MKLQFASIAFAALLPLLTGASPAAAQAGGDRVTTYHSNGDGASFSTYSSDSSGFSYGYVSVNRGGPPSAPITWLYYQFQTCAITNSWYYTCSQQAGNGTIPNDDFSGSGGRYRLQTDTTANPAFFVWAGPGGLIDVEWKKTETYQSRQSGVNEYSYFGFSYQTNGTSRSSSASASGNVAGNSVPANGGYQSAYVGSSELTYIYKASH